MFSMTVTTDDPSKFNAVIAAFQNTDTKNLAPLTETGANCLRNEAYRALNQLALTMGVDAADAVLRKFNVKKFSDVRTGLWGVRTQDYAALIKVATTCIEAVTV
jgi:hypothetical protein